MIDHIHIKELISADFDGQATAEEKRLIKEHLLECSSCRDYARQLNKLSATLDEWDNEDLSPDLEQKVQQGLKEVITRGEKSALRQHPLFKVGVGGGGALVVVLILILSMQVYSQRALQGRLKSASDDIGQQFSPGTTRTADGRPAMQARSIDGGEYLRKDTGVSLDSTVQYEPYYLTSDYFVKDEGKRSVSELRATPEKTTTATQGFIGENKKNMRLKAGFQESTYASSEHQRLAGTNGKPAEEMMSPTTRSLALKKSEIPVQYKYQQGYADGRDYSRAVSNKESFLVHNGLGYPDYDRQYRREPYPYPTDTEEYAPVYENGFLEAQYNPLSTFSIDVDTTAYSNIRRFLNNGQLPPADAVRIEEMINYFHYDYPQPKWGKPFSVTTQASHCPWNPQHYLVQVGIKGKVMSSKKVPPSNLVFLIDVSGSMNQNDKLPLLKDSFRMFIDQLSGNERVAIVVYSGSASVVLDSTPGSDKWRIAQAIDNLSAGGSTAGAAGIHLAYDIAQRNFIKNGNNRVILATDGDFNVGVSSDSELVRLIETKRDNGIFLSILGFGTGNYKDAKMEQIADKGNGNYFYIDSLKEGRKVLVDELGSTIFTIAKDVKLQVEFNPAEVKAYKLIGYENRALANQDFNDDTKDAGELGAGHTVTAFYEVIPAVSTAYSTPGVDRLKYQPTSKAMFINTDLMTVKLRYKDPQGSSSKMIKSIIHRRDITNTPSDDFQFASAVAEFGLLLRNSPYRAGASYDHILMRARRYQGTDKFGHKAEFANLVEKARSLDHRPVYQTTPVPYPYPEYYETSDSNINFKGE